MTSWLEREESEVAISHVMIMCAEKKPQPNWAQRVTVHDHYMYHITRRLTAELIIILKLKKSYDLFLLSFLCFQNQEIKRVMNMGPEPEEGPPAPHVVQRWVIERSRCQLHGHGTPCRLPSELNRHSPRSGRNSNKHFSCNLFLTNDSVFVQCPSNSYITVIASL